MISQERRKVKRKIKIKKIKFLIKIKNNKEVEASRGVR